MNGAKMNGAQINGTQINGTQITGTKGTTKSISPNDLNFQAAIDGFKILFLSSLVELSCLLPRLKTRVDSLFRIAQYIDRSMAISSRSCIACAKATTVLEELR